MTSPDKAAPKNLHIFVNKKKFGEESGVKKRMTGGEIAALIGVTPENAVVRRGSQTDSSEVGANEQIEIRQAEHFLVTRKVVNGGWLSRVSDTYVG